MAEVDARIEDLRTIRANLGAALDTGYDDLTACAAADCCPIPFLDTATPSAPKVTQ